MVTQLREPNGLQALLAEMEQILGGRVDSHFGTISRQNSIVHIRFCTYFASKI